MDNEIAITAIMIRAIKSKILVVTANEQLADRLETELKVWSQMKQLKCRSYFTERTFYVDGFQAVSFIPVVDFNKQNCRSYDGEAYYLGDGIITTLETAPLPLETLITQHLHKYGDLCDKN